MEPILKWAGGKRQLLQDLKEIIEPKLNGKNKYFEPFIGGGSLAFYFEYGKTIINDFNHELINVYKEIKKEPALIIEELKKHEEMHYNDSNYYYEVRNWDRLEEYNLLSNYKRAARIIYLNKTCYNGLYRVNSKGYYNVPKGRPTSSKIDIVMENKINNLSDFFKKKQVVIRNCDFAKAVRDAEAGDVIYFDPPYDYDGEGFKTYVKTGFNHEDLDRLKTLCDRLIEKGCFVVVSNNDTAYVRQCFSDPKYTIKEVIAKRYINCDGKNRTRAREVIIYG